MSWFAFALLSTLLFSSGVLVDKYLLTRPLKRLSELSFTTMSGLAGLPLLLVLVAITRTIPELRTMLFGIVVGWLLLAAYQLYYKAIKRADAALVSTLFQLILPFNFLIGVFIFNDHPTILQALGLPIVALGAWIISLEEKEKKWRLRADVLLLMAGASILISLSDAVFKYALEDVSYTKLAIAEYASSVLAGILLVSLVPKVRNEVISLRRSAKKIVSMLELNELFTLSATLALRYSIFLGPFALIQGVLATQPVMVLLLTWTLGILGLKINALHGKKMGLKALSLQLGSIFIVCCGSILISGYKF